MIDILPKIESREKFENMAGRYGIKVACFSDACLADNRLRAARQGYCPSSLLRAWYGAYGYTRSNNDGPRAA